MNHYPQSYLQLKPPITADTTKEMFLASPLSLFYRFPDTFYSIAFQHGADIDNMFHPVLIGGKITGCGIELIIFLCRVSEGLFDIYFPVKLP